MLSAVSARTSSYLCIKMILKLPIEILDKVFGYLKNKDQLTLAQVNQQLGCAFAYHARGKYRRLNFGQFTTESDLKVILDLCGSTVVQIEVPNNFVKSDNVMNVIFKLIAKHCVNLASACVFITSFNFNACKHLLAMKCLKTIKIVFNQSNYPETDIFQYINPDCKVLTVENISKRQAANIRKLINLEELTVRRSNPDLRNVFQIGSNLNKLRVLCLHDCTHDPAFQLHDIEYHQLEELEFNIGVASHIFNVIASYGSTLEHLIINYYDFFRPKFTGTQLINVLRKCERLKCLGASTDLIADLFTESLQYFIALLKENGFNKESRFLINASGPYDCKKFCECKKQIANSEVWNLITLDEKLF
ncbi:uncharacterized protein LOC111064774 isoform X2 [Drosophila obscura]|uniref:uncharacterized protein LOC111064774 isoform X2 n=1 Tax=Drosophila obscura TaxID=7282 RepID=UPI000BA0FC60|nr:uncharacterized protein LOC111064774 isoform X2 [Drosophila obscura]